MKVNILDAHDRLGVYSKQADYISKGCIECINSRPKEFGNHPFYIFAHARTEDDGFTKRLLWCPRLTKPKAQTNSMLFKAYPPGDKIKVVWMIPERSMWSNFEKGKLIENQIINESIYEFENNRNKLEAKEPNDLQDYQVNDIYDEISRNAQGRKTLAMLKTSEEFLTFSEKVSKNYPSLDQS